MLKPNEIREKTFEQVEEGVYSAQEVDAFLKEVSASYEQVFKQNGELVRRLSLLANRLEAFRRQEEEENKKPSQNDNMEQFNETVRIKLEQAKAVAQKMLDEAKERAVGIVNNANKESDRILIDLNDKIKEQRIALELLNSQSADFKKQLIEIYRQHLMSIDAIPAKAEQILKSKEPVNDFTSDTSKKPYVVDVDNSDIFGKVDDFVDRLDEPVEIPKKENPVVPEEAEVKDAQAVEDVFSGIDSVENEEASSDVKDDAEYNKAIESIEDITAAADSFSFDFAGISFDDDDSDEEDDDDDENDSDDNETSADSESDSDEGFHLNKDVFSED